VDTNAIKNGHGNAAAIEAEKRVRVEKEVAADVACLQHGAEEENLQLIVHLVRGREDEGLFETTVWSHSVVQDMVTSQLGEFEKVNMRLGDIELDIDASWLQNGVESGAHISCIVERGGRSYNPWDTADALSVVAGHECQRETDSYGVTRSYDFLVKLLVLGGRGVGKTSLVHQFAQGTFPEHAYSSNSIGVDFTIKTMEVGGKVCKCQIWDVPDPLDTPDRFDGYPGACPYFAAHDNAGIVMAYDVTSDQVDPASQHWLHEISRHDASPPMIFVGCKSDIRSESETPSYLEDCQKVLTKRDLQVPIFETSSKSGEKVDEAFGALILEVAKRMCLRAQDSEQGTGRPLRLRFPAVPSHLLTRNIRTLQPEVRPGGASESAGRCNVLGPCIVA